MYVDLVVFGTGCMFIEMEDKTLRFSTRHISEFFIQENQKRFSRKASKMGYASFW